MTAPLADQTKKALFDMAKKRGIVGVDRMSREQLIKVLSTKPAAKPAAKPAPKPVPAKVAAKIVPQPKSSKPAPAPARPAAKPAAKLPPAKPAPAPATKPAPPVSRQTPPPLTKPVGKVETKPKPKPLPIPVSKPIPRIDPPIPPEKDLAARGKTGVKDQIWLMVSDPFWLHACWELSAQSVQRAEAALGQDWHGAKPCIRLFDVTSQDTTSTSETPVKDFILHGGCNHWHIDVPQPPKSYRADIGYLTRRGGFHVLARSNVVTPPKTAGGDPLPEDWAKDVDDSAAERILAMSTGFEQSGGPPQLRELFDEQYKRATKENAFGPGAVLPEKLKKFAFEIQTELIVHGKTDPTAHVTIQNEPVKLRADGSFTMRYTLTDGRQILPAVAQAADGMEERTIVLAVERNTKHLDPTIHDLYGEN
jgi:uncharacterized protein